VLATPSDDQVALIVENEVDTLAGEQTWPTEEEMADAAKQQSENRDKSMKRVPKGTSTYQAAWILDEEDSDLGSDDEDEEDDVMDAPTLVVPDVDVNGEEIEDEEEEEEEDIHLGAAEDDEDPKERAIMFAAELSARKKQREEDDLEFPDEMDTPEDTFARVRFAKYRGLKSFRTSTWDPKESLPQEYSRVFAFNNFKRTQKVAINEQLALAGRSDALPIGCYVRISIARVPAAAVQTLLHTRGETVSATAGAGVMLAHPLTLCGLLQHESKLSVLHMGATKCQAYTAPVRSKDPVTIQCGFRAFAAVRPVYSTDTVNMDKHKFDRFLQPGAAYVASIYAPITYPSAPVLALAVCPLSGRPEVVFTGSLRGADPERINLKRIILSGVPAKVHKRKSVVQFMFHNPEDVRYFRPMEVWTKFGRRGRIKEPLGTHGRMKVLFDGVITQRDSICISLYKRVFPPV